MTESAASRLCLLIDADDTLWENNIYFEEAIRRFLDLCAPCRVDEAKAQELLHRLELAEIEKHGYGLKGFHTAMLAAAAHLFARPLSKEERRRIADIARSIVERPVELIAGVAETLPRLRERCSLMLVTKGDAAEQLDKFRRSGVAEFFDAAEVLPEKNEAAYRRLVAKHRLAVELCWMIGNSPKSDVNASLAAGLNAVYIPHSTVWIHERAALAQPLPGRRRLQLPDFAALTSAFCD